MLFPVIRVRDKGSKDKGVLVGSNTHHQLVLDDNGNIKFTNLQCMEGTGRDGGYEFVTKKSDYEHEIEMVTFDELLEIYKEQIKLSSEKERRIRNFIKEFTNREREENGLNEDDGIRHTAGNIF
jgi:hypothetical protein